MITRTAVESPSSNFLFLCAISHELSSKVYGLFIKHPNVIQMISRLVSLELHPGIITSDFSLHGSNLHGCMIPINILLSSQVSSHSPSA